jgi:hypothetical protein
MILGVVGFLGISEKDVAVPFNAIKLTEKTPLFPWFKSLFQDLFAGSPETSRHLLKLIVRNPNAFGIAVGVSGMLIHTAEGKRSIDDELVLCIDRHRGESERCTVTVYLLSGEQVTGILETALPDDHSPLLAA